MCPTEEKNGPIFTASGMWISARTASTSSMYRSSTRSAVSSGSAAMKYTFSSSASAPASCSRLACAIQLPTVMPFSEAITGTSSSRAHASRWRTYASAPVL